MTHSGHSNPLPESKPVYQTTAFSLLRTILSLLLFIAVDYLLFKNWTAVCLLVAVIFIHQLGHFTAMKIFGYKRINMTFVPFLGAYVSGEASHFSRYKKIVMLLAGPVPGIIAGMIFLYLYQQDFNHYYRFTALAFLLLNIFNLFPVSLLDGGQIIDTLFPKASKIIQTCFLIALLITVSYLFYVFKLWFLIAIALLIIWRLQSMRLIYGVRRELDKKDIPYDFAYDELTDEQYAQIRDVLVTKSQLLRKRFLPGEASVRESELISYIEKILMPSYQHNLTRAQKVTLLTIYLLVFIIPLLQWLSSKYI